MTRLVIVESRSVALLNGTKDCRAGKRMSVVEVVGDALLSGVYDSPPRPLILGKRTFQRLLDNHHLGLRCDQIGITRRRLPIGRAKLLRRHTPAVARHLPPLRSCISGCCIGDVDIFEDAFDALPAHLDSVAGARLAVGNCLFQSHAPNLVLPAAIELNGYIGRRLGIVPIAVGCPTKLNQTP